MNNYVPYVWRKDYSNNGPLAGKKFYKLRTKERANIWAALPHHQSTLIPEMQMMARFD